MSTRKTCTDKKIPSGGGEERGQKNWKRQRAKSKREENLSAKKRKRQGIKNRRR